MPSQFRYEPRVYWEHAGPLAADARVRLNRENFRNGEPFDTILTHALIAPIGIPHRNGSGTSYGANAGALRDTRIRVRFPQRYGYSRLLDLSYDYACEPVSLPVSLAAQSWRAGHLNVCAWHFDEPVEMEPTAPVQVTFTPFWRSNAGGVAPALRDIRPELSLAFYQKAPWLGARYATTRKVGDRQAMVFDFGTNTNIPFPIGADAGAYDIAADAEGIALNATTFGPKELAASGGGAHAAQLVRNQPAKITGFGITVDQIALDDATNAAGGAPRIYMPLMNNAGIHVTPARSAPGRARAWWRDFPCISLVCPSISDLSTVVYKLPNPIRLCAGDALDCEAQGGANGILVGNFNALYNVGLSFCGYAEIPMEE